MNNRFMIRLFVFILPLTLCPTPVASQGTCATRTSWPSVFHHICEFPHLQEILIRYPALTQDWLTGRRVQHLCLLGGHLFTEACIYLELYPAHTADEFWILDGSQAPGSDGFPAPLLLLRREGGVLLVSSPGGSPEPYSSERESRLNILVEDGQLMLTEFGEQSPAGDALGRPRLSYRLDVPDGVYFATPCPLDSCMGCGPPALDIYLPRIDAGSWVVGVAEAAIRAENTDHLDTVLEGDDWESIAYRNYRSRCLMLIACAANPKVGVVPGAGAALAIPEPRTVLPSDRLLYRQSNALDLVFQARYRYEIGRPRYAEALAAVPHTVGDPGPEGRPLLRLTKDEVQLMTEVKELLNAAADSLAGCHGENIMVPTRAVGQLRSAAHFAGLLSTGSNDGYGYDLDMIGQHLDLAVRNLTIWAQEGFQR